MKQINLSQNQIAVLDDEDHARLSAFKWFYRGERNGRPGYAIRHGKKTDATTTIYMHREIMSPPVGYEVIFLNHDRLDCRKANLKVVTTEEARQHHRMRSDCKTGAKGVRQDPHTGVWRGYIYRQGIAYCVGTFGFKEDAEKGVQEALRRENPELHTAPTVVERKVELPDQEACSASVA